ncbi:unnamed protein product [Pleuronectes platessa]|uniref:Uncharacterized protein n=1 Tax=Pleuronectes platessa TaxID=8262 RepID=A0A9N7V924_PLEPL|nr:unnamed protein product [Pleuronectes platessa]
MDNSDEPEDLLDGKIVFQKNKDRTFSKTKVICTLCEKTLSFHRSNTRLTTATRSMCWSARGVQVECAKPDSLARHIVQKKRPHAEVSLGKMLNPKWPLLLEKVLHIDEMHRFELSAIRSTFQLRQELLCAAGSRWLRSWGQHYSWVGSLSLNPPPHSVLCASTVERSEIESDMKEKCDMNPTLRSPYIVVALGNHHPV